MSQDALHAPSRLVQIRKLVRFACDRGFAKFTDLDLTSDRFTTSGVLLAAKNTRSVSFATLTDGRDHIQLIFAHDLSGTTPEFLETLQRGAKVCIAGIPFLAGRSAEQAVPSLYVVDVHSSSQAAPVKFDEDSLRREITPRLIIGHLMAFVSKQLEARGYSRYEPQFITSSRVDLETEPLMVRFPGRGADVFLEVSPLPQLLYAAVMTGEKKIYSPTRLFSRAYRDGFTSADSPIVAAVEVELGLDKKSTLEEVAQYIISAFRSAQDTGLPFELIPKSGPVITKITNGDPGFSIDGVKVMIKNQTPPLTTTYAYDIRKKIDVETQSGQVFIEGHEGRIAQVIPYHWLCVHVERLVLGDLWRIRERKGPEPGSKP